MMQTDQKANSRKTSSDQKSLPERGQGRPETESLSPELTLRTLLSGASPDRLSPDGLLALSHSLGNSVLLDLITGRGRPPERETCPVPGPLPEMEAAVLDEGEPELIPPVEFAGLPHIEAALGPEPGSVGG